MTKEQLNAREPTNCSENKTEQKPVAVGKLSPAFLSQLRGSGVQGRWRKLGSCESVLTSRWGKDGKMRAAQFAPSRQWL